MNRKKRMQLLAFRLPILCIIIAGTTMINTLCMGSEGKAKNEYTNQFYILIGKVHATKNVKEPGYSEILTRTNHGGTIRCIASIYWNQLVLRDVYVYKVTNEIAANISSNQEVILLANISLKIRPGDKRRILYAKKYVPRESFIETHKLHDALILKVMEGKYQIINEGEIMFQYRLKQHGITFPPSKHDEENNSAGNTLPH
jgi:hypothetical protein